MPDPIQALNEALEGRYRVERELGAGGMAVVYLARDLRHERDVAIKVLKPELAAVIGAERFLAEIKTTASLQHPHILPLFDSGVAAGFLFYVMPFVQGESVRDRLEREKQLPVTEAVRLARAVGSALDHAHRQGVVHRDIKPANLLVHDGEPMVADFGIALAVQHAGGRLTETGMSVGTPYYMSPEQATGDRDPDARSDVYSLGCVLYETLTGDPPFPGSTAQSVLAKILTEDVPRVREARRAVPAHVEAVVAKATERLPADRFGSAADLVSALGDPTFRHGTGPVAATAMTAAWFPSLRQSWALLAAAGAGALLVFQGLGDRTPAPPEIHTQLSTEVTVSGGVVGRVDVSPDGSRIAYTGTDGATRIRTLSTTDAERLLLDGSTAWAPEFSPDGSELLLTVPGPPGRTSELIRVTGSGVVPELLTEVEYPGASWGDDGYVYFVGPERPGRISRVPETGGAPEILLEPEGESGWFHPATLPGGRGVLVTRIGAQGAEGQVHVLDLATGETQPLGIRGRAIYVPTGHIVYAGSDGVVLADDFDVRRFELGGAPWPLVEGIEVEGTAGFHPPFSLSDAGDLVYLRSQAQRGETLVIVDREGRSTPVDPDRIVGDLETVAVSPDGRYLAMELRAEPGPGPSDLWVYDLERSTLSRLTRTDHDEQLPTWAADGRTLLYVANPNGVYDLYTVPFDASAPPTLARSLGMPVWEAQESQEGRYLILKVENADSDRDILFLDRRGPDSIQTFLGTPAVETNPQLSPDGRWLAYMSNESGRDEVYVRAFPGGGRRYPVTRDGGINPAWASSGNELFYIERDSLMSVSVAERADELELGEPTALLDAERFVRTRWELRWSVMPDDQEFVFIEREDPQVEVWIDTNRLNSLGSGRPR